MCRASSYVGFKGLGFHRAPLKESGIGFQGLACQGSSKGRVKGFRV